MSGEQPAFPGIPRSLDPVERRTIDSWRDFSRHLLDLALKQGRIGESRPGVDLDGRRYIFRGSRRSDWLLQSKFQREWDHTAPIVRARVHGDLLDAFGSQCRRRGVPSEICDSPTELEAFGQHHGLPTRLLDWTLNPLIAAFFASADAVFNLTEQATHLVVHALRTDSPAWSSQQEAIEIVTVRAAYHQRARCQQGVFTYDRSNSRDIDSYLRACADDIGDDVGTSGPVLIHIELPRSEAIKALEELELLGINFPAMFPDEFGLTQSALLKTILGFARRWQPG